MSSTDSMPEIQRDGRHPLQGSDLCVLFLVRPPLEEFLVASGRFWYDPSGVKSQGVSPLNVTPNLITIHP